MPAIVDLAPLAALVVAVALILLVRAIVQGLFSPLFNVPGAGGYIRSAVTAAIHALNSAVGLAVAGIERLVGASWHLTSRLTDWLWDELKKHANLIAYISPLLASALLALRGIKYLAHHAASLVHSVPARFKAVAHEVEHLLHRVKAIEHDLTHGIGNDVLPRIKALDKRVAHLADDVIPAVEGANEALAKDITALGDYIRSNFLSSATDAVTAAVAVALSALGLGGLRCSSLLNSLSNRGCGLWNGLEDLLGLLFDAVIFLDLCHVIPEATTLFAEFEAPLTDLISSAANAACATQTDAGGKLPTPTLYLPSNPGLVLSLP